MVDFTDDFSTYAVSKLPTFRDNFNYSTQDLGDASWVSSDTALIRVDPVNEELDFDWTNHSVSDRIYHDLGFTISETDWVLRCKATFSNVGENTINGYCIGLYDSNAQDSGVVQDWVHIFMSDTINLRFGDNSDLLSGAGVVESSALTLPTVGVPVFWELKRIGGSIFRLTQYSDSNYSVIIDSVELTGVPTTVDGLRFIKCLNRNDAGVGQITGTFDDIEFWDQRLMPTFFDNFTTDNWVDTGLGFGVNTGTEVLDGSVQLDGNDNHTSFDLQTILGTTVDDDRWVLRFRVKILSLVAGSSTGFTFAVSDTEAGGALGIIQDSVSGAFDLFPSIPVQGYGLGNTSGDDAPLPIQAFPASKIAVSISTDGSTDYFVELKRLSSTQVSMRVFTEASFTTPLAGLSQRTIVSTIQNLRFIKFFDREITQSGSMTFEVDDIEFYNGVSSVTGLGSQQGDITFQDDFVLKPVTFSDDFTTDQWVDTDPTNIGVNISTEKLEFDMKLDGTNDTSVFDLGINGISDSEWILRGVIRFSTLTSSVDGRTPYIMLTSGDETINSNLGVEDKIGWNFDFDDTDQRLVLLEADNQISQFVNSFALVPTIATDFFWELKRVGSTITIRIYSDPDYTNQIGIVTSTLTGSPVNLRFIKVGNSSSSETASTIIGTIDDVEFYNGTSTLTDWTGTGTKMVLNTSTKEVDWDGVRDGTNHAISHDLQKSIGVNADDDNWTLRWKWLPVNTTAPTTDPNYIYMALSDSDDSVASSSAQDFVTVFFQRGVTNFDIIGNAGTTGFHVAGDIVFTEGLWSAGTPIYVEMKRTSVGQFEISLYSDSAFRNLIERQISTNIDATVNGLRYIKIQNRTQSASDGSFDGIIDDIEFYNGVSVPRTPIEEVKDHEDFFIADNYTNMNGTKVGVNTTTQVIDWSSSVNAVYNEGEFNDIIGKEISTDRWTLRCKLVINTVTAGGDTTANDLFIGFSDDNTSLPQNAQDYIGWRFGMNNPDGIIRTVTSDDLAINSSPGGGGNIFSTPITTGTFYLETKRIGSDIIGTLYSDPDFTQVIEAVTEPIEVGITGLRFLKVMVSNVDGSANSTFDGTIDDIQFWDGQDAKEHKNIWKVEG